MSEFAKLQRIVKGTHSTFTETPDRTKQLICVALGLSGEAGEVTDLLKKWYEQGHALDEDKMLLELADVSYYVMLGLMALSKTPEDMVNALEKKLSRRYPNGFSSVSSINRDETTHGSDE